MHQIAQALKDAGVAADELAVVQKVLGALEQQKLSFSAHLVVSIISSAVDIAAAEIN